jgi:hypothetical protein
VLWMQVVVLLLVLTKDFCCTLFALCLLGYLFSIVSHVCFWAQAVLMAVQAVLRVATLKVMIRTH